VSCPRTEHNVPGQGSNPDHSIRLGIELTNHKATARTNRNNKFTVVFSFFPFVFVISFVFISPTRCLYFNSIQRLVCHGNYPYMASRGGESLIVFNFVSSHSSFDKTLIYISHCHLRLQICYMLTIRFSFPRAPWKP